MEFIAINPETDLYFNGLAFIEPLKKYAKRFCGPVAVESFQAMWDNPVKLIPAEIPCRVRKDFENAHDAYYADLDGGWYFVYDDGRVSWYSMEWTPTPLLMDARGNGQVLFRKEVKAHAGL